MKNKKSKWNMVVAAILFMVLAGILIGGYFVYFNNTMFQHSMNKFIIDLWIGSATNS